jgi:fructose-1,6-bisphosphatase/sedoheptulose 1,7-bisphosphatase-like protein
MTTPNKDPIWAKTPATTYGATIATANTAKDGTGTVVLIATAGANGAILRKVVCEAIGTNIASTLRLFRNNGSTNATPANNSLIKQVSLPATTLTEVAGQSPVEIVLNMPMVAGERLYATIGTTVAAGWSLSVHQGDF